LRRARKGFFVGKTQKGAMAMRNKTRIPSAASAAANTVEIDARRTRERLRMMERKNPLRDRAHDGDNTPWADSLEALQDDMAKNEYLAGREVLVARLKALSRAEAKVREGTYGLCDSCGKPIPSGRLQAVPGAVHCVRCAEGLERDNAAVRQPLWVGEDHLAAA
jgi:RNA polymerase-binding transcription factor DksA